MSEEIELGRHVRDRRYAARHGVVLRVRPTAADVRWDGKIVDSEEQLSNLRRETTDEEQQRVADEALRAWRQRRPRCDHVSVGFNDEFVRMADKTDPDKMERAGEELIRLAAWFREDPRIGKR